MANHKSSEKRIRQTVAKRAHNRLFHKTARNAVKALRNTTCGRGTSPEGYFDAGQAGQAQYRAQEQSRQPEKFVADACKRLVRDCYPMLKFKSRQNLTALRYLYRFTEILLFE